MRSKLILALLLLIGLFFPMLPKQGGRAAAPSASGRSVCASRIPVRANSLPETSADESATSFGTACSLHIFTIFVIVPSGQV